MKLSFRQGIVSYPQSGNVQEFLQLNAGVINLRTTNGPTTVTFAHKDTDYLLSEGQDVAGAWGPFTTTPVWLYWDIDRATGQRTFGHTELQPVKGPTAPLSPANGQHWFDTVNTTHYVRQNNQWVEVIRVFAAKFDGSTFSFLGTNTKLPYAGTQVGINQTSFAGNILFDEDGNPVVQSSNGTFYTTETEFFAGSTRVNGIRLESDVITAVYNENIPAYRVVKFATNNRVELANYNDVNDAAVAITTQQGVINDLRTIIVQGTITNENWNWPDIGAPLYVEQNGELTLNDPHITNPGLYPDPKVPVARVIGPQRIIFMQGLGGVGPQGPTGSVSNLPDASDTQKGAVLLSVAPTTATLPIAVGVNDPFVTNGPYAPASHTHPAVDITFTPAGDVTSANVQDAIEELDTEKLSLAGGTMIGDLILNGDPTALNEAATKNYVDQFVSGLIWLDAVCLVNLISDSVSTPPVSPELGDAYIMPAGALSGAWSGFAADDVVEWDGSAWQNGGNLDTNFPSARFVVSGTSSTAASGTFAGQDNSVAVRDSIGDSWSFQTVVNNNAVFVCNMFSVNAFNQYVYDAPNTTWVLFNGGQVVPGLNLSLSGNTLNVTQWSSGGTIDAATLQGNDPTDFVAVAHLSDSSAHDAVNIDNTPASGSTFGTPVTAANVTATDVQGAINELLNEKAQKTPSYSALVDLPAASSVQGMIVWVVAEQKLYVSDNSTWIPLVREDFSLPYDLAMFSGGPMTSPDVIDGAIIVPRAVVVESGAPNSVAFANTAPAGNISYDIQRIPAGGGPAVSIGSVDFLAGLGSGTFTFPAQVTFSAGDQIHIVTPNPIDANIADVAITIVGCAAASPC